MSTVIKNPNDISQKNTKSLRSRFRNILSWNSEEQKNRIGWETLALVVFGCILTPLTILMTSLNGANLFFIMTAIVVMEVNLMTGLLVLPTKISIPIFFSGILVDFGIIIICAFRIII
jgi:hypothetical protein